MSDQTQEAQIETPTQNTQEILVVTPIQEINPNPSKISTEIQNPNPQEKEAEMSKEVETKTASSSSGLADKVKEWKKRKAVKLEKSVEEGTEEEDTEDVKEKDEKDDAQSEGEEIKALERSAVRVEQAEGKLQEMQLKIKALEAVVKKQDKNLADAVTKLENRIMEAAAGTKADMDKILKLLEE